MVVGTINGSIMTLLAATVAICLLASGSPATAGPYFNSSEPGCNGSDSNVLFCDDFESGTWYVTDGDAAGGMTNPANKGWGGTIYANPITPAGAIRCGAGVTPFGNCAADGGFHDPAQTEGGRNMALHRLKTPTCGSTGIERCGVPEVYVRWYMKWDPGYLFAQEKNLNVTNSDGDIAFADIQIGCGAGTRSSIGTPSVQVYHCSANCAAWSNCGPQNRGNNISFQPGRWYFVEFHVRTDQVSGVAGTGRIRLWINDCGTDGRSCGPTPILRFDGTGGLPGNTNGNLIETIWLENWAGNPGSAGNGPLWDQMKVSRVGPIGFSGSSGGGSVSGVAPSPPASPDLR